MEFFICPWDTTYYFIAESVPPLLYYSHVPATMVALLVGIFVYLSNRKSSKGRLLITLFTLFSFWTIIDLFLWSNNRTELTMFWWSVQIISELLIYSTAIVLVHEYLFERFISFRKFSLIALFLLPALVLLPTTLYLVNISDYCVPEESSFIIYYSYLFEVLSIISIVTLSLIGILREKVLRSARETVLFTLGIVLFLISFTSGNVVGSITENWNIAQFGLFGMPIFIGLLAYLIVKYNTFQVKLLATQAFVVTLWLLIGSMLLVVQSTTSRVVAGITLVLALVFGYFLVRSVKREVRLRQEVENLAQSLAIANEKLKDLDKLKSEFVSIASHQLRAPLTAIRGYTSMLLDGSYGKMPPQTTEPLERISESAKNMAYSVEDYLNISRIESGNMKYSYSDFNLRNEVENICDDLRPQAMRKGVVLLFRTDLKCQGVINADIGKTIQIIQNLLNNSIKYTPKGSIRVLVRDDVVRKKIFIDIEDTGIGMDEEMKNRLFSKFERAKNANSVNTGGTGLGLYVAYEMTKAMKGNITAYSEGDGKGSRFTIEFPLAL